MKKLSFAEYNDSILRESIGEVSFPLSEEDKQIIQKMKYSIADESAAGMAANQWGIRKRIFLYCPEGNPAEEVEVVINPSYEPISIETEDSWEGCFSIPLATGNIRRYLHIKATYQNEQGEVITRELKNWLARVFQHETDHLDGFLYDDPRSGKCLEKETFQSEEELMQFYRKKRDERLAKT